MSASSPREVADRQCGQRSEKHQYVSDSHSDRSASNLSFLMMSDVPLMLFQRARHTSSCSHTPCAHGVQVWGTYEKKIVGCHLLSETMLEQCWNNVGMGVSLSLLSKVFRKKYKKGGVCPQVHPVKSRTDSADKDPKNTNMCRTPTLTARHQTSVFSCWVMCLPSCFKTCYFSIGFARA